MPPVGIPSETGLVQVMNSIAAQNFYCQPASRPRRPGPICEGGVGGICVSIESSVANAVTWKLQGYPGGWV